MSDGTAIYKILGLTPQATETEIKAAYHRQALERHPDRNPDDPEAAERFARVKKAYDLLSDPGRRREWHRHHGLLTPGGAAQAKPPPPRDESLDLVCTACDGPARECAGCGGHVCKHLAIKIFGDSLKILCLPCAAEAKELTRRMQHLKRGFGGRL